MEDFSELYRIGQSPAFTDAHGLIGRFAGFNATVLVQTKACALTEGYCDITSVVGEPASRTTQYPGDATMHVSPGRAPSWGTPPLCALDGAVGRPR